MFSKALLAATALSFVPAATAHMVMANPIPFAGMDNSPLNNAAPGSSGSNFPCKIPAGGKYQIQKMNSIAVDTPTELSFTGGATHGGGSCQVSVTMDKEPTVNSQWKVVHSIVGGCPSSAAGNLNGDPNSSGASKFQFSLPKGMPNGQYTLAWTWFNKVGNREMYMNCAPITVTGGASDTKVLESLPDMFVMNLPRESCNAPEGGDLQFPNPGDSVDQVVKSNLISKFVGDGCTAMEKLGAGSGKASTPAAASGGSSGSSGSGSSGAAASSTAAQPSAGIGSGSGSGSGAASSAAAQPTGSANNGQYTGEGASKPTNGGGQFAQGASSAAASSPTATSLITVIQPSTAPTAAAPSAAAPSAAMPSAPATPANGSSSSSGSCAAGATACSNEGGVVCLAGNMWGLCDHGCVVPQLMAAGMGCEAGNMKAVVGRRSRVARHARAHHAGLGGVF